MEQDWQAEDNSLLKEENKDQQAMARPRKRLWTQRIADPIRYERFTDLAPDGFQHIYFRFEDQNRSDAGPNPLDAAVYAIMDRHKKIPGEGARKSGLHFKRDRYHDKVWVLPDQPSGRAMADDIDYQLMRLAERLKQEQRNPSR